MGTQQSKLLKFKNSNQQDNSGRITERIHRLRYSIHLAHVNEYLIKISKTATFSSEPCIAL